MLTDVANFEVTAAKSGVDVNAFCHGHNNAMLNAEIDSRVINLS